MKICPTCRQQYEKPEQMFCSQDGTALVAAPPQDEPPPGAWQKINLQAAQNPPVEVSVEIEHPKRAYFPGDIIRGTVMLNGASSSLSGQNLAIGLIYEEQYISIISQRVSSRSTDAWGKDYKDHEYHYTNVKNFDSYWVRGKQITETDLKGGAARQTFDFALQIPANAVPPYTSEVIVSAWSIKVLYGSSVLHEIFIPLIVPPPGEMAQAGQYGTQEDEGRLTMRFALPKLGYVEGETINGQIVAVAREDMKLYRIVVKFERHDEVNVPKQENHKIFDTQTINIAENAVLRSGVAAAFDFSIPLHSPNHPTRQSPSGINRSFCTLTAEIHRKTWIVIGEQPSVKTEIFFYNGNCLNQA